VLQAFLVAADLPRPSYVQLQTSRGHCAVECRLGDSAMAVGRGSDFDEASEAAAIEVMMELQQLQQLQSESHRASDVHLGPG